MNRPTHRLVPPPRELVAGASPANRAITQSAIDAVQRRLGEVARQQLARLPLPVRAVTLTTDGGDQ